MRTLRVQVLQPVLRYGLLKERMAALMQEIPFADQIHMIPFSAVKGDGVEQLRAIIDEIAQDDAEQAREEPCR